MDIHTSPELRRVNEDYYYHDLLLHLLSVQTLSTTESRLGIGGLDGLGWVSCVLCPAGPNNFSTFTRLSKDAEINEKSTKKLQDQPKKPESVTCGVLFLWLFFSSSYRAREDLSQLRIRASCFVQEWNGIQVCK